MLVHALKTTEPSTRTNAKNAAKRLPTLRSAGPRPLVNGVKTDMVNAQLTAPLMLVSAGDPCYRRNPLQESRVPHVQRCAIHAQVSVRTRTASFGGTHA